MVGPWIRGLSRIAVIAIAVIAALALPWAISWLWRWLPQRWDTWIIVAITADAALVLLAGIWWLWWRLPRHQVAWLALKIRDPKARADAEDNFRKTVGQALGGAAVLIGAGAAYMQFTQQQQASRDLLASNQVSKGFEQLASDKITMRLGGLYALEGAMNTSPDYRQPVLEALCAFVRDGTIGMIVNERPATDIQAALTVIGRRKGEAAQVDILDSVDLDSAVLSGASLRYARLNHASLSNTNLKGANLQGARLYLSKLSDANLESANLQDALLVFTDLRGADLRGANLSGAMLSRADLSRADLTDAKNLDQSRLDQACGTDAKLPPGLTLRPCPEEPVAPPLNPGSTP